MPFDFKGDELGHHDGKCFFDAFVEKYSITDPAVLKEPSASGGCPGLKRERLSSHSLFFRGVPLRFHSSCKPSQASLRPSF
ncbi:chromate resistance protein ChrB domain-containing protein [Thermococcus sp. JdF3]|uniref:chromate resistance protein ChrB domain-containing protein n=1 Tax=Thermococcus sp. JdF3 TaxID=1638258 RepID=UPI00351B61AA